MQEVDPKVILKSSFKNFRDSLTNQLRGLILTSIT